MRRALVAALAAIAVLFGGSLYLISAWTAAPSAPARAPLAATGERPPAGGEAGVAVVVELPSATPGVPPAATPGLDAVPAPAAARAPEARPPAPGGVGRLKVSFRLDPALTRGLHMGERWVSPPRFVATRDGQLVTIPARASGADASGRAFRNPIWRPAAPDVLAVSRDQGRQVELTVLRPGESELTVSEGGATKTLLVRAEQQADRWQVEITQ